MVTKYLVKGVAMDCCCEKATNVGWKL